MTFREPFGIAPVCSYILHTSLTRLLLVSSAIALGHWCIHVLSGGKKEEEGGTYRQSGQERVKKDGRGGSDKTHDVTDMSWIPYW